MMFDRDVLVWATACRRVDEARAACIAADIELADAVRAMEDAGAALARRAGDLPAPSTTAVTTKSPGGCA